MESAHLYRLALANARETVLLVDHTKFAAASLFRIVEWDMIDHIVTDLPPDKEWTDFLTAKNIKVHFPEPPEAGTTETPELSQLTT
jgi:DeoR/GlpR family transcriptional regulator of sugar metabolism